MDKIEVAFSVKPGDWIWDDLDVRAARISEELAALQRTTYPWLTGTCVWNSIDGADDAVARTPGNMVVSADLHDDQPVTEVLTRVTRGMCPGFEFESITASVVHYEDDEGFELSV